MVFSNHKYNRDPVHPEYDVYTSGEIIDSNKVNMNTNRTIGWKSHINLKWNLIPAKFTYGRAI